MGTSITEKGFKALVPGKAFVQGTFNIVAFQKMMSHFINYVQQCPIPSIVTSNSKGKLDPDVILQLDAINVSLKNHYVKIQNDSQKVLIKVHDADAVLGQIWHFSRIGGLSVKAIYNAVKASPNPLSPETIGKVSKYLNSIDKSLADLESKIPANSFDAIHKELNNDVSNLNSDFTNMQGAIPYADGAKLDLSNLTECQAAQKLDSQINSLNNDIGNLQAEIAWETVGQVAIGIVGGLIAITNFWNPVGWAAAAGVGVGEAELTMDKAKKMTKVDLEQTQVFVSQAEKSILLPYFACKQYASQIKAMVSGLENLSQGIGNIRTFINASLQDMEGFISDLGDAQSLELDYGLVSGDFTELTSCIHNLMGPDAFANDPVIDPKWGTMANDGKWAQILSDPNSPFYIKLLVDNKS